MTCRYVSATEPRVIGGRHAEECPGEACKGCQPCSEPHCRICGKEHAQGACGACAGETRDDLKAIRDMCCDLRTQVVHVGVESEAMSLLGPAADPEAWGHITTSLKVGRLPVGYLGSCARCKNPWPCKDHADGELHPLFVLGMWEQVWRDALEHETNALVTIPDAVAYLGKQLTYMAGYEHAPFEDFARDLRKCRAHLEAVLHDQNQGDRANVGCFECGGDLERRLSTTGFEDHWTCRKCRQRYTAPEYNFALRAKLEDAATKDSA